MIFSGGLLRQPAFHYALKKSVPAGNAGTVMFL